MQYLMIQDKDTLASIAKIVGYNNIDAVLAENGLTRTPKIGKQWKAKCERLLADNPPEVTSSRKMSLLNGLTGSEELFEKACLMDEDEWKIFSAFQSFRNALRIPETVTLPLSERVIGDPGGTLTSGIANNAVSGSSSGRSTRNRYGNKNAVSSDLLPTGTSVINSTATGISSLVTRSSVGAVYDMYNQQLGSDPYQSIGSYSGNNSQSSVTGYNNSSASQSTPVDPVAYRAVMKVLSLSDFIDPAIFNSINTSPAVGATESTQGASGSASNPVSWNLPWGKIQLYSSLLDQLIDIPAFPEEFDTARSASYTSMPDLIYQYEPWIMYQSSGPREQTLTFHLHRDMWTGDHRDGKANELIRFCEANTFPRYSGSSVLAPTVKIYISGKTFISGVITHTSTRWRGPIGLDDWPLEFELTLTMSEVSETALNIDTVSKFGLIGE